MENIQIIKSIETVSIDGYVPDNRAFIVVDKIKDEIFIHGGSNKIKEYTQVDIFDTKSMEWKVITDISTSNPFFIFDKPLSGHTSTKVDNNIYIIGGFDGNSYSGAIYNIDTEDYAFTQVDIRGNNEYPMARNYHTANYCYIDNVIYVYGGWNGNISTSASNNFTSLWKFNLKRIYY